MSVVPAPDETRADELREPQEHIGFLIRRAQQVHVATWTRVVSPEISSVQYSILAVIDRRGEVSQRELGDEIDLDRSTIGDLVARMERHGLITRRRDVQDGRRNTVTLTPHGLAERRRLYPLVVQAQDELVGSLDAADRTALRRALTRMLTGT
ncbi:MAG: MarR family winged helix-turn-helix transcriptional regulator [Nostocoides sp.]